MIYLPILGSFFEAGGTILEKKVLKKHKISSTDYAIYGFLAIVLVMLPFVYFSWNISSEAYTIKNMLIFIAICVTSLFANLLTYYSIKRRDLTELEPIRLVQPLLTILITFIFSFFFVEFYSERNYYILFLGLIASIAVIFPHVQKHHLKCNKCIISALIGSFLFALEIVLSKFILQYYNSFTFYFLRCLFIFVLSWIIFHPSIKSIKNKTKIFMLFISIIWVFYRIILYYGIENYGIMLTTIIMSILTPVFIFIFAAVFLKEKIKMKHIISAVIIVICVIGSLIIENQELISNIIRVIMH